MGYPPPRGGTPKPAEALLYNPKKGRGWRGGGCFALAGSSHAGCAVGSGMVPAVVTAGAGSQHLHPVPLSPSGPLNWYRNIRPNWRWALSAKDRKVGTGPVPRGAFADPAPSPRPLSPASPTDHDASADGHGREGCGAASQHEQGHGGVGKPAWSQPSPGTGVHRIHPASLRSHCGRALGQVHPTQMGWIWPRCGDIT